MRPFGAFVIWLLFEYRLAMSSSDRLKGTVVDAGPLIYLAKIGALDVFGRTAPGWISPGVRREAVTPPAAYRFPEIATIDAAIRDGRILVAELRPEEVTLAADLKARIPGLGQGERESIAMAAGRGWSVVLLDRRALRVARMLGVSVVAVVELLFDRTSEDEILARRLRHFASLVDMRIDTLERLLEQVKERS